MLGVFANVADKTLLIVVQRPFCLLREKLRESDHSMPEPECSAQALAAKAEPETMSGIPRCVQLQRRIPKTTPLITYRPNTEEPDSAIVRPKAETNVRR